MAVTLAQAKLNTQDDVDLMVIDEFRKSSWLLDNLPFDDVVNPAGGGATLTYGYTRLITQPTAGFRAINSEYDKTEVTRQRYTTDLKVLGGAFQIDRVLANMGPAASGEVSLQMSQKIKAANATFSDAVINGDSAVDADSFDGLDKALAGSTTELNLGTATGYDWSAVNSQVTGIAALKHLRRLYAKLDGAPTALLMNADALAALETIGDFVSQLGTLDAFGRTITTWRGVPLVDLGAKAGSNDSVIPTDTTAGTTDIYAVRIGLDGFHGISTTGGALVRQWLPDFTSAGAVKTGEVEMGPVGVALKATKAAAVLRGVKVA
ncbi:major capsid protein [Streptomyces phage Darolandstone]|uniref:Major capsid protein n=1 Tax=Streptomyces phage Darolandstone TaxID=2315716 RepID=A0A386KMP5_9CAUD|nr:major head protein [Streptomyces phage Darolandstone]AYD86199.1 major capsid protein [Streptomyces phage Darolandstone]